MTIEQFTDWCFDLIEGACGVLMIVAVGWFLLGKSMQKVRGLIR